MSAAGAAAPALGAQQEGAVGAQQLLAIGAQQLVGAQQVLRGAQQLLELPQLLQLLPQRLPQLLCLQHFTLQHLCLQQFRAWTSEALMAKLTVATTTAASDNSLRVIACSPFWTEMWHNTNSNVHPVPTHGKSSFEHISGSET